MIKIMETSVMRVVKCGSEMVEVSKDRKGMTGYFPESLPTNSFA